MAWEYQTDYAPTLELAKERFNRSLDADPFPDLEGALLNSAHIAAYGRESGLLFPFNESRIKSATYPARIGARVHYWDISNGTDTECITIDLKMGQTFKLPKFSLVFVETEETFLLPHYIAARFNLQIEFVHKGLLLGTGPLVDPGFAGNILIPLHNLTINEYELARGQELIWVEFTKTSNLEKWTSAADRDRAEVEVRAIETRQGFPRSFPEDKRYVTTEAYLNKARMNRARMDKVDTFLYPMIAHATGNDLKLAIKKADKAQIVAERMQRFGVIAAAGLGLAILALFFNAFALSYELMQQRSQLNDRLTRLELDYPTLKPELADIRKQLRDLAAKKQGPSAVEEPETPQLSPPTTPPLPPQTAPQAPKSP